ncbi:DUF58 domain-containing protein [Candidatus Woesearchaeota archaeon]|nr:DUF58 domain-containing protein [Candidatus Woesearchaeota archaeon]
MKLKEFKADLSPYSKKQNFSAHKNVLNKLLVGNLVSEFKNRGMEFEDYRKYTIEDDAQRIDWKATLRANQLLIRQTTEEKAVNVLFLLDVSDTMLFSSGESLKCEYAAEIISGLSFAIQREGNAIGLCMFNEGIVKVVKPKVGAEQYYNIINELSNPKNYGGGSNLKNALRQALALLKIPALVIIFSDFINLAQGWQKYLEVVALQYDIIGINIRDPRDRILPLNAGYFVIEDPTSHQKILIDTKEHYDIYKNNIDDEERALGKSFKNAKATVLTLQTNQEHFNPLIQFLEKRVRVR